MSQPKLTNPQKEMLLNIKKNGMTYYEGHEPFFDYNKSALFPNQTTASNLVEKKLITVKDDGKCVLTKEALAIINPKTTKNDTTKS